METLSFGGPEVGSGDGGGLSVVVWTVATVVVVSAVDVVEVDDGVNAAEVRVSWLSALQAERSNTPANTATSDLVTTMSVVSPGPDRSACCEADVDLNLHDLPEGYVDGGKNRVCERTRGADSRFAEAVAGSDRGLA